VEEVDLGKRMAKPTSVRPVRFALESDNSNLLAPPREWSSATVSPTGNNRSLDLAPDGKHFVVFPPSTATSGDGKSTVHVTVLLDFFDELKSEGAGKITPHQMFCSGRGGQRTGSKLGPLNHAATSNSSWKSRRVCTGVR
jgi:hypothetical protein